MTAWLERVLRREGLQADRRTEVPVDLPYASLSRRLLLRR
jgi:hypothetical protein